MPTLIPLTGFHLPDGKLAITFDLHGTPCMTGLMAATSRWNIHESGVHAGIPNQVVRLGQAAFSNGLPDVDYRSLT